MRCESDFCHPFITSFFLLLIFQGGGGTYKIPPPSPYLVIDLGKAGKQADYDGQSYDNRYYRDHGNGPGIPTGGTLVIDEVLDYGENNDADKRGDGCINKTFCSHILFPKRQITVNYLQKYPAD
jgi:hypothetical protein